MKATEANFLAFLKKSPQFVIPIYQRTYSWTSKECRQLWDDIVRAGTAEAISVHFIGSIVYIEAGLSQVSYQAPLLVIDGQQRLTTATLLLAALAKALDDTEPIDGFSARKLRNYYLVNPEEVGERHYKLLLSQTDRSSLSAIVAGNEQPAEQSIRVTEAYVFRRAICAIPTNSMNKTFGTFAKVLKKDRYLESIKAHFLTLPSYRRFPNDDEFRRDLQTRDLYNFRSRSYWLRRFENHGRKERVAVDEYTIEHIMPQNEALSAEWKAALGPQWERVHQTWLHTLGNLTLTGYNSEYSDRPFLEKRGMPGGFRESPLKVNAGLGQLDRWDEDAIKARGEKLAAMAPEVWRAPLLPAEILAAYSPGTVAPATYSIENHPHLLSATMRDLFEAFRKEVIALDPCVTEEFLKLYVAYKAETNFVDVVPQAKQLRLSLNMDFAEISDPRGMCKDVAGLGRWGNGDVEVRLTIRDELPYIIGLVRQSLERQLGTGADA
jgi:predicted transport protein